MKVKTVARTKTWVENSKISTVIDAYWVPGLNVATLGSSPELKVLKKSKKFSDDYLLLTKSFFENAGVEAPEDSIPVQAYIYKYGSDPYYSERGSGREAVMVLEFEFEGKKRQMVLGTKGAGTNSEFSGVNGEFDITNFRKNGLQAETEVITEQIAYEIAKKRRIPVIETHEVRLFNFKSLGIKTWLSSAGQTIRELEAPRLAWQPDDITDAQKSKLVAALYMGNIMHGALNLENVDSNGKIVDLGHFGPSYPIISG
ncbi:MAG: hypothetical protein KDD25_10465, partial [Bdellovibrionales bacterium]|nr:hypothetical protein [Bdellovibrionales bacterium]